MSKTIPFGPAESVKKEKNPETGVVTEVRTPRTLLFRTKIDKANAGSLPVDKKGNVLLVVNPADIPLVQPESYAELVSVGGDKFEARVLEVFKAAIKNQVRTHITGKALNIEVPPTDVVQWVKDRAAEVTLASIFAEAQRGRVAYKEVVKNKATELQEAIKNGTISMDEIQAQLAALIAA